MPAGSVLVVEDEGLIALHISEVLEREGYTVLGPVGSGAEALRTMKSAGKIDLVLMDIQLPGTLDGIEVARIIRRYCFRPLIFITALTSKTITDRMEALKPEGILHKPFEVSALTRMVSEAIRGRGC